MCGSYKSPLCLRRIAGGSENCHRGRLNFFFFEFGGKASIVTNHRRAAGGLFVLHARAPPDNPYDGHTLRDVIDRTETLMGCSIERAYVDKGTAATTHKIPVASLSSGQKRASSVSSSASCAAAPPSSPSSDTSRLKVTSDAATSKAAQETQPTSSSQPWATTSAASSPGSGSCCACYCSRYGACSPVRPPLNSAS